MKTQRMEEQILISIDNLLQNIAFAVNRRSKNGSTTILMDKVEVLHGKTKLHF